MDGSFKAKLTILSNALYPSYKLFESDPTLRHGLLFISKGDEHSPVCEYIVLLIMTGTLSDNCLLEYRQFISGCLRSSKVNRDYSLIQSNFYQI